MSGHDRKISHSGRKKSRGSQKNRHGMVEKLVAAVKIIVAKSSQRSNNSSRLGQKISRGGQKNSRGCQQNRRGMVKKVVAADKKK